MDVYAQQQSSCLVIQCSTCHCNSCVTLQVSKWRSNIQGACFGKPADLSKLLSRLRAVGPPVGSTPSAAPPLIMVQPQLQGQSEAFAAAAAMDANLSVQGIGQLLLGCAAGKVGAIVVKQCGSNKHRQQACDEHSCMPEVLGAGSMQRVDIV